MLFLVIIEYLWPTILENSCTAVQSQNAVSAYFTSKQILHFGFVQVYKYTVPWDPQKNKKKQTERFSNWYLPFIIFYLNAGRKLLEQKASMLQVILILCHDW